MVSADEVKPDKGEAASETDDGSLSVLPSKRKLLLGAAAVVAAFVAYKLVMSGSKGNGADDGDEIEVESGSLEERLHDLDDKLDEEEGDEDTEDVDLETDSFEEQQQTAVEELAEDKPDYGGGE